MDLLITHFTKVMLGAIILVVVISQLHRLAGAVIGVIVWIGVAVIGTGVYEHGAQIGLPGMPFPRPVFYLFCAFMASLNVISAVVHARKRRSARDE